MNKGTRNELRIAKKFHSPRNSLSGKNSKAGTSADILNPIFYVETKERERVPFYTVFLDTVQKGRNEGKIPLLIIHKKSAKKDILIMNLDDFLKLIQKNGSQLNPEAVKEMVEGFK